MEEVSEEEEGCERGVPHSMCPWLFAAPALLTVEQVGGGWWVGVEGGGCWTLTVSIPAWCRAKILGPILSTPPPPPPSASLSAYLADSLVGFNNSV